MTIYDIDDIDKNGDAFDVKPITGDNSDFFNIAKFIWILFH